MKLGKWTFQAEYYSYKQVCPVRVIRNFDIIRTRESDALFLLTNRSCNFNSQVSINNEHEWFCAGLS